MYHQKHQITGIANFSLGLNITILPKLAKFNSQEI